MEADVVDTVAVHMIAAAAAETETVVAATAVAADTVVVAATAIGIEAAAKDMTGAAEA